LLENLVYRQALAAVALVELILIIEDYMLFSASAERLNLVPHPDYP